MAEGDHLGEGKGRGRGGEGRGGEGRGRGSNESGEGWEHWAHIRGHPIVSFTGQGMSSCKQPVSKYPAHMNIYPHMNIDIKSFEFK